MANYDYVFLKAGTADGVLPAVARTSADAIASATVQGGVAWRTPAGRTATARVRPNWIGGPDEFAPDDIAAYAAYEVMIEVGVRGADAGTQLAEARRVFDGLRSRRPEWSSLLVQGLDTLVAAWHERSLTEFPELTSAFTEDRMVWNGAAVPFRITR
jgi:hypothetical protein